MAYDSNKPQRREKAGWGSIKKNQSDNPNAPIMKGGVTIKGSEYWVSLFRSRKTPGSYDLSFEDKEPRQAREYQAPPQRQHDDFDEFDR